MKNVIVNSLFNRNASAISQKGAKTALSLAAMLLCGLAVPSAAQTLKVAPEKGFTVTPGVSTPIVLKTFPGAVCELYGSDTPSKSLRFLANGDGYLKIHARPEQESEEARVQLDCAGKNGKAVRYPLHVRGSISPTEDMPMPESALPTPRGSSVRPALTAADAESLSAEELVRRGYSLRPNASADAEAQDLWLQQVTREMTILPASKMGPSRIRHGAVQAGGDTQNYNWSGFISITKKRTYDWVDGQWNVPEIFHCERNTTTWSALWAGIDGYNLSDLAQAGTEQDCTNSGGVNFYNYYSWSELLPNEPTEQPQYYVNPGDSMFVQVWIGDANGNADMKGAYFIFRITDITQNIDTGAQYVPLNGTYINGSEAEWIAERPGFAGGGGFAQLSDYNYAYMVANAFNSTKSTWYDYSQLPGLTELWMYNEYLEGNDNHLLSKATKASATKIYFQWENYH
jgi:hypothetical protein